MFPEEIKPSKYPSARDTYTLLSQYAFILLALESKNCPDEAIVAVLDTYPISFVQCLSTITWNLSYG